MSAPISALIPAPLAKQLIPAALALIMAVALFAPGSQAAELDRIGSFDFPTSGSPEAHEHFTLGVGYLHSFGFIQAQREFRLAQELDPDFAMAYWGEVFTYNHPFIPMVWDGESPGAVMRRLGKTSEERMAKAPTEREKGFLRAAEAFALTPGPVGHQRTAWMEAMGDLYEQFPDDREVAAFYAVSTLSGATAAGDQRQRLNMRAGALALELFRENPNHPGAAHYVIHAFDDPIHAPIALAAAFKYATIAPAVSHARHMPTHIFIQHGMWEEVAKWNESAFDAAAALWEPGDRPNDQNHSADWGQYGDLQMGDLERSKMWIARAEEVLQKNSDDRRSHTTLRTMRARHIIESQQWETRPVSDDLIASELLALGIGAAHLGEWGVVYRVNERLGKMVDEDSDNVSLNVSYAEVSALDMMGQIIHSSAPEADRLFAKAVAVLEEAVALTERQRLPNGAANPLKPVHEFTGELLLRHGDAEEAVAYFETSLLRTPNRPWSLLGAARSYAKLDNTAKARAMYQAVLSNWDDDSRAEVQEAREYLASSGG
ncbi:MAG: tetratricopeptide repeat protein [Pseudohongiellaceae bacterium]